ncbi:hypothetical protein Q73_03475 [Bacillus coahuilensis m2-6]|uniref:DNA repair exonuclease n=1 Tax=Bacillus coahuilensis TaxID=408580 RepID=UPI0007505581|nr:DNA repair exonuclease [Bacillus coahuilensis]KUP09347.1 hypothetical protein Q73_03475 [Bacillus coahuilensis m2-6]
MIRFIHCADLHLDSPFIGLTGIPSKVFDRIHQSTFLSFERIISVAIDKQVDFICISGDLFDGEDRSIKAQVRLQKQLNRLHHAGIPCFILHGNHDHLSGKWVTLELPENVTVFKEDVEEKSFFSKSGERVTISGFSYGTRQVFDRKITDYPVAKGEGYHIGMLHGSEGTKSGEHIPYAPFTIEELLGKKMDYWALGHIHKRQILHEDPYIVYPGNIQGRSMKESGEKGCYLVEMNSVSTEATFYSTNAILFEKISVEVSESLTLTELINKLEEWKNRRRQEQRSNLIEFELVGDFSPSLQRSLEEIVETLQDREEEEEYFVWVTGITYSQAKNESSLQAYHPLLTLLKNWELDDVHQATEELLLHPQANRYIMDHFSLHQERLLHKAIGILEGKE